MIQKQSIKVNLKEKELSIYSLKIKFKYKKEFEINNDCRVYKVNSKYYISVPREIKVSSAPQKLRWCGGDLGVKTILTTCGSDGYSEYHFNKSKLNKLNEEIDALKKYKRTPKKAFYKREERKKNLINALHWEIVNHLTDNYDIIKIGKFQPKNIVEQSSNRTLNRDIQDLKFFVLQQRLIYKASVKAKLVIQINERNTTKTCSSCGCLNDVGLSRDYHCLNCNLKCGRDFNSSKNMVLKE